MILYGCKFFKGGVRLIILSSAHTNEIIKRFVKVTRHIRRISTCQFCFFILPVPIVESLLHLSRAWHNLCDLKSLENLLQFSVIS